MKIFLQVKWWIFKHKYLKRHAIDTHARVYQDGTSHTFYWCECKEYATL